MLRGEGIGRRWRGAATLLACTVPLVACTSSPAPARPVVTVFGSFTDRDADAFAASMAAFERSSGIDVRYVGSSNFEADLLERVRRGDPPDLALVPQPGLLRGLAEEGLALPYDDELADAARADVDSRLVGLIEMNSVPYGSWYAVTPKSLVWYSPQRFRELGLQAPAT